MRRWIYTVVVVTIVSYGTILRWWYKLYRRMRGL